MDPLVMRAGMPDLIALAFYRLGYRPRESLVMVGMHAPRNRLGLVIRADLPSPRRRAELISAELKRLRRHGEEALVALVVSDAAPPASARGQIRLPHRALVRTVRREVTGSGLTLQDVIAVGDTRWRSYLCTDPACCPAQGRSMDLVTTSSAAAMMVTQGVVLASDEQALIADVEPGTAAVEHTAHGRVLDAAEGLRRWRELLANPPDALRPQDLAWLVPGLADRWLRDGVLLTLVPGTAGAAEQVVLEHDGSGLDRVLDVEPDAELLERGRRLLAEVARRAPRGARGDALALLAWAAWWSGEGTRGRLLAARALQDQPDHRLARLVDQLLMFGVPPTWAERIRPTAAG